MGWDESLEFLRISMKTSFFPLIASRQLPISHLGWFAPALLILGSMVDAASCRIRESARHRAR
jgi:hypothetical protein